MGMIVPMVIEVMSVFEWLSKNYSTRNAGPAPKEIITKNFAILREAIAGIILINAFSKSPVQ
jgi:hypothetical protein